MMRIWWVCLVVACGSSSPPTTPPGPSKQNGAGAGAPLAAGCVRQRPASHPACIGMDRGDGNMDSVVVCDGCVTSADCTASAGGTCESTGGGMCDAPAAFVCRYPQDACTGCPVCSNDTRGAPRCSQGIQNYPPSMDR